MATKKKSTDDSDTNTQPKARIEASAKSTARKKTTTTKRKTTGKSSSRSTTPAKQSESDRLDALTAQMDELRGSIAAIASHVADRASDTAGSVADTGKSAARTVAGTASAMAESATEAHRKLKESNGYDTAKALAQVAPAALTVARRMPGGKKVVAAGLVAGLAYLAYDAYANGEKPKSA